MAITADAINRQAAIRAGERLSEAFLAFKKKPGTLTMGALVMCALDHQQAYIAYTETKGKAKQ